MWDSTDKVLIASFVLVLFIACCLLAYGSSSDE